MTELEKLSYALGMSMGNNFKSSGIEELNIKEFADGVSAVFEGAQPKMSYDEAKNVIRDFFMALEQKQNEAAAKMCEVNKAAGEAFLAENATPAIYYNLQGMKVENPQGGVFIKVQGEKASKLYVK